MQRLGHARCVAHALVWVTLGAIAPAMARSGAAPVPPQAAPGRTAPLSAGDRPVYGSPQWKPAPPRYDTAPEPWRSYLLKAREADAISDPMQRCLAFPALPGTQWPANLIPAHCEYVFGLHLNLDDIKQHLDSNDLAGLEAIFRKLQDRHFSEGDFSEHIHNAIGLFVGDYASGAVSKRWLEAAPDSPFAMTARAEFYRSMGWAARGGAYAQETPDEQLARMKEFHAKARALYTQALAKEPRLMPAHAGLVDIAKNGDSADDEFAAGYAADPACEVLLRWHMEGLKPRWGGSYRQMDALEAKMLPYMDRRPLLALARTGSYDDKSDIAVAAKEYKLSVFALKPMLAVSSSPQVTDDLASSLGQIEDADHWEQLAYMVHSTRFRTGDAWHARQRGRQQMLLARDPELANRSLAASVKAEPGSLFGHYLYAASFSQLGRVDDAEREYLVALQDTPDTSNHRDSLLELADMMVWARRGDKAREYAKRAVTEYPDNAQAWLVHTRAISMGGATIAPLRASMESFLAKADANDPRYQKEIAGMRKMLADMREYTIKNGGTW
jgi:tetratricopeptide (TPR) repeat protein